MKRFIYISIIMLLLSNILIAQSNYFEGYDGLAWGSSIQELKEKYPDVIEITEEEEKANKQRNFEYNAGKFSRMFHFFDNELYLGRTYYADVNNDFTYTLVEKVVEEYGFITDKGEVKKPGFNSYWFKIAVTEEFSVVIELNELVDNYGRITSNGIIVNFLDVERHLRMQEYIRSIMKKDIEL